MTRPKTVRSAKAGTAKEVWRGATKPGEAVVTHGQLPGPYTAIGTIGMGDGRFHTIGHPNGHTIGHPITGNGAGFYVMLPDRHVMWVDCSEVITSAVQHWYDHRDQQKEAP